MKQLKKIMINKTKIMSNDIIYIKRTYHQKIVNLKIYNNFKTEPKFYNLKFIEFQNLLNNVNLNKVFYTEYTSYPLEDRFATSKFHTFDSYLTSLELIDCTFLKKKFNYKYKYSMFTYFIPFLIKNGKKLSTINFILKGISTIYDNLKYNKLSQFESYSYVNQFKHYIDTADDVYNINFLIHWIINIYKPVFDVKCFNVPKVHKKKSAKTVLFKIVYLSEKNRLKTAYKHISTCIRQDNSAKLNNRITNIFLDLLLNYKKSYLYTRKMYIYEQVMDM
uniref:Ymf63 n=1 Tax=Tetrahymena thermophila TaxID=5911 RepID=Q951A4_TETTH|nr:ymf63 [Tetrahymena thermophila]AAK77579.1 ymf63 [Tetrahymena thermophila]6Z1P_Bh Chain Bh, Ymf63 [Tetrahymena thermophila SB210]